MIEPLPTDIFQVGQILNNTYEIQGVLGRGGTGEVYRAVNQVTGRVFAIKALNAQFSGNADYVELMKREEEIRSIIHDAVVRYNECTRTDSGHVILVMDYIAGPSLADAMASRRFEPRELLIVGHRVAEGLVVAHAHGIVHRDLSPDNIILRDGAAEKATLIDFGIAKDTGAGARTIVGNDFAGKYEYAAPEQVEGNAVRKSDLYALGATLLAVYRGEIPYLGTTPGEIVRRKQSPLDTEGVPEPLKSLVDTLSAPDPDDRPTDAAAAASMIEAYLKPLGDAKARSSRQGPRDTTKRRSGVPLGIGALVLVAMAATGYVYRDAIFGPGLETVSPYTLEASKSADGVTDLHGHAPNETEAGALRSAFASATGTPMETLELALAEGMPYETWSADIADLIGRLDGLESWDLSVSDGEVRLSGVAPSRSSMAGIEDDLANWDAATRATLRSDILAGPVELTAGAVDAVLDAVENCGPLAVNGERFALGERVGVRGHVAAARDGEAIRQILTSEIGSRPLDVNVSVMNEELCAIRSMLPAVTSSNVSIWLGNGRDGTPNLTGVYRTGENPIAEIQVPASMSDGFLWVMVVDNTGKVFHILPNINNTEQRLERLGTVQGGMRQIRVLHSVADVAKNRDRIAVQVNEGDYGKSEIIAILSSAPLFDLRRPKDESVASAAEALAEALAGREDDILGIATRVIDARE